MKIFKKILRNKLSVIGILLFLLIFLSCIFAPFLTPYNPSSIDMMNMSKAPSSSHIFGTDNIGRDVFSRILYGGRVSMLVGALGALFGTLIGTFLGAIAGYFGGKIDSALVRCSEVFLTIPDLILILVLSTIFGQGVGNIILVFTITGWMTTFRIVRSGFMQTKQETFVSACQSFGISDSRIIFNNILPNTLSPVCVAFSVNVAGFVLAEAGLSFIGVGIPSDVPTWGNIINAAKSIDVIKNYWWLWIIPGLAISGFVLSINFMGDALRDIMDPKE